jgi:hypothetical protein
MMDSSSSKQVRIDPMEKARLAFLIFWLTVWLIIVFSIAAEAGENVLPWDSGCIEQDHLSIEDEGDHMATVIYSNSVESCSNDFDGILTAPNGISARVVIDTGNGPDPGETIYIYPRGVGFIADPPMGYLLDNSESKTFLIYGAMS